MRPHEMAGCACLDEWIGWKDWRKRSTGSFIPRLGQSFIGFTRWSDICISDQMAEWDRLDRRTHARRWVPVGRQIEQLTGGRKTVAPLAASHAEAARLLQSIEVAVPQIGVETEVVKRQLFAATDNRVGPHCEQSSFGSISEIELSPEPIKPLVRTVRSSAAGLAQ